MILYKYLSSFRIDTLFNCKIRYTQFGDFNDPYELNPNIDWIAEEEDLIKLTKADLPKLIEQEYDKYPVVHTLISKSNFFELVQSQESNIVQFVLSLQPTISKLLPTLIQDVFNSKIGVLCLSENAKNDLMWSHYAEEHRGFVLGFDSTHNYFNQKISPSDELRHLRKVNYSYKRPKINLMNTNGVELFLNKGKNWQYELEWRIMRPLSEAVEIIKKEPYPICLFNFPTSAISEVIFGLRMSEDKKKIIKQKLVNDIEYSHIKLYQSHLNETDFTIELKPLI